MGKRVVSRLNVVLALGLLVLTFAAFWLVLANQFVSYDDSKYVTENPHVQGGLSKETVAWAFTTFRASNWHPLTWLSHSLDCRLYGLNPVGHHLTNLLLHVANALLLFLVLLRMTGSAWRSAFVAALFGVHPLHVESVAWVAERKDVLSTFFWMLTMLAYVRYVESPSARRYLPVVIVFGIGLLAKPMLVTLPFVLLLLDYWPLGRLAIGGARSPSTSDSLRGRVWEKTPLFLLAAGSCIITFVAQHRGGSVAGFEGFSLAARIGNALVSYVRYIEKMFWPSRLACFYPHPGNSLPVWQPVLAGLALLGMTLLILRLAGRHPYLMTGWLWYVGTLVPVIGLVQVGFQAMADRYTYVSLIGLFIILAWGGPELLQRGKGERETGRRGARANRRIGESGKRRAGDSHTPILPRSHVRALAVVASVWIVVLVGCAWAQVRYWRDTFSLCERAIVVTEGNYIAHNNLGQSLAAQRRFDEAIVHYRKALETDPDPGLTYNNLGAALAETGQFEQAMQNFRQSVTSDPECVEGHTNLGRGLAMQGRLDGAIEQLSEALSLDPENAAAHLEMGNVLGGQGKLEDAAERFSQALRFKPDSAEAHSNLGYVFRRQGRLDEAILHLQQAINLKPDLAAAHYNLAIILYTKGDYAGAWSEIRFAQKCGLNPDPQVLKALSRKMPEPH